MTIRDISKYDEGWKSVPIYWDQYQGFMIRCYDGGTRDPWYDRHVLKAKEYGKAWWPYAFYDFRYPADNQIAEILEIVRPDPGNAPTCFDVEEWGANKFPERSVLLNGMNVLFRGYKTDQGHNPQWYLSPVVIDYLRPVPSWLTECQLHIAHWKTFYPDFAPWGTWTVQQTQGDPDYNRFNGTDEQFYNWLLTKPAPPGTIPPVPGGEGLYMRSLTQDLRIRKDPSIIAPIVGTLKLGEVVKVTNAGGADGWVKHDRGWSCASRLGKRYMEPK